MGVRGRASFATAVTWLSVLWVGTTAAAATYYIAPAGNDSNACLAARNAATPKGTFASAISCLQPGDELVLRNGTYSKAINGQLLANCDTGTAKSGLGEGQRITVRAENERQAHLLDDGNTWGIVNVIGCNYWTIQGLHISAVQNTAATVSSMGIMVQGGAHVIVRRNLVHDLNHYNGSGAIVYNYGASDGLVEENEAYNMNRDIIYALKVPRMTFRRNYCWGGKPPPRTGPAGTGGPHVCILAYQITDSVFENNIAEYTASLGDGGAADAFGDTGANNRWLGNIAIGSRNGFEITKHTNKYMAQRDSVLENNVVIGMAGQEVMLNGFKAVSTLNLQVRNMSIFGSGTNGMYANNQYDPRNGATSQLQQDPELTVTNTLVQDTPTGFLSEHTAQFNVLAWSHSAGWNNSATAWGSGTTTRDVATTPPLGVATTSDLGTCRVFIPATSSLKGKGKSGADIGANILYRYQDGVQTQQPLWNPTTGAFPCGAVVSGVNDKPGQSCRDVHLRLNVNTNGCMLPPGYGSGDKTPSAPTALMVR